MRYLTHSPEETQQVAKKLASKFKTKGAVIALSGDLGAGKTTFVQGFAKALGIKQKIISPTFIITRAYPIPDTNRLLYHIDLYRLEEIQQLETLGLGEIFTNPDNITLIEWPDRLGSLAPLNLITITIDHIDQNQRLINIVDEDTKPNQR